MPITGTRACLCGCGVVSDGSLADTGELRQGAEQTQQQDDGEDEDIERILKQTDNERDGTTTHDVDIHVTVSDVDSDCDHQVA